MTTRSEPRPSRALVAFLLSALAAAGVQFAVANWASMEEAILFLFRALG